MADLLRSTNPVSKRECICRRDSDRRNDDDSGHGQQDRLAAVVCCGHGGLDLGSEPFRRRRRQLYSWMLGGAIGGFVVALVTIFKKEWSPISAPIYALLEGLLLGRHLRDI